ncbi:MAG: lipoyl(octanoyl) transferase LipB [Candidatus Dadabacteria bacterium]|nr:lipoyl(octanoyl) transferase LipB [Candidatus Dadabacteria bacterium]
MNAVDPESRLTIHCEWHGTVPYADGLSLQEERARAVRQGGPEGSLILLEHPPVLTDGRFGKGGNFLLPEDEIRRRGVGIHRTGRGGDVTFHGPGQLVSYPIIRLRDFGLGARAYVGALEETIMLTLGDYGIEATRREGYPGVWTAGRKIASIGVAVRGGVTMHGSALNVNTDLSYFSLIVPCGIADVTVTSMEEILGKELDLKDVARSYARNFGEVLGAEIKISGDAVPGS